jgi:hypothetical protein
MLKKFMKKSLTGKFVYDFMTGTAIIVFWKGVWGLLDLYLFPDQPLLSYVICIIIGLAIVFINDSSISELHE